MDRLEEAREALVDGLQFEPNDKASQVVLTRYWCPGPPMLTMQELNSFFEEIDAKLKEMEA